MEGAAPKVLLKTCLDRLLVESNLHRYTKEVSMEISAGLETLVKEPITLTTVDSYWNVFKACLSASNPARLREIALDCIQKLLAHGVLRGAVPLIKKRNASLTKVVRQPPPPKTAEEAVEDQEKQEPPPKEVSSVKEKPRSDQNFYMIDEIITVTCASTHLSPISTGAAEEAVQLQIIKVLLTALTTTSCEVHGISLLKVIQTCFSIHLNSKNLVNQATAKASLTQMCNLIFSRMENYAEVLSRTVLTTSASTTFLLKESSHKLSNSTAKAKEIESLETAAYPSEPTNNTVADLPGCIDSPPKINTTAPGEIVSNGIDSSEKNNVVQDMLDDDIPSSHLSENGKPPTDSIPKPLTSPTQNHDEEGNSLPAASEEASNNGSNPYDPSIAFYNELLRKDVFLTFRLLCRLSMLTSDAAHHTSSADASSTSHPALSASSIKQQSANTDELSHTSIRARSLALELILSILNSCGPVLLSEELYVNLVRQHLCSAIARNGISTHPHLFELSLSIFLMIIRQYRSKLIHEIEILMNTVYLHILEMGNSTHKQKIMVLQALLKICETPQTLLDIFVNYDCNLGLVSIFERIVNVSARCAQGGRGVEFVGPPNFQPPSGAADINGQVSPSISAKSSGGLLSYAASSIGAVGEYVGVGAAKNEAAKAQDKKLRLHGLCCLVAVINSLVEWSMQIAPTLPLVAAGGKILTPANNRSASNASLENDSDDPEQSKPHKVGPKTLLEAIGSTNQSNPVLVDRRPLNSVSLSSPDHIRTNSHASTTASLNMSSTGDDYHEIEGRASRKQKLRQCINLFNTKPNKGVKLLIECKFIDETPLSCALFLKNNELDKAAMGNFLGEVDPYNVRCMHAFIDCIDFKSMNFVAALRYMLQAFRLPGEAQKIDRIMEKFADRYCETNPGIFAKADTAYTLAYSVIMLNTDQHSSQIRHRMDKAAFIKNNRGINDNGDLPNEFLSAIFDEISQDEIIMESEHAGNFAKLAVGWGADDLINDQEREENYRKEIALIQKKSQELINDAFANKRMSDSDPVSSNNRTVFRSAEHSDLARPMFAMASWSVMATFSLLFEAANDNTDLGEEEQNDDSTSVELLLSKGNEPNVADLCLRGFSGAIRVASLFKMETERDAFVTSLAKLTGLSHVSEMKFKNVKAIKTLLSLGHVLGEYLEGSWLEIIKITSSVERLHMAWNVSLDHANGDGNNTSKETLTRASTDSKQEDGSLGNINIKRTFGVGTRTDDLVIALTSGKVPPSLEKVLIEISSQSMAISVDRIFSHTVHLSSVAIIHFFKALCAVSLEEVGLDASTITHPGSPISSPLLTFPSVIKDPNSSGIISAMSGPPRMYLLQKIVEIAYYNVHRIRFEWSQIWRILQPHFNTVSCHPNVQVATFAVDSLRQLSMKFLERDELAHYNTHHEFLKSFEWIMKNNVHPVIRELIVSSISQMMSSRANNIKSGWKSIFVVLCKAASPPTHISSKGENLNGGLVMTVKEWEKLVRMSYELMQVVFNSQFQVVVSAGAFVDYVSALSEYALMEGSGDVHDEAVMGCMKIMGECGKILVEQAEKEKTENLSKPLLPESSALHLDPTYVKNNTPTDASQSEKNAFGRRDSSSMAIRSLMTPYLLPNGLISEDHFYLKWFPLLSAMSRIVNDATSDLVRTSMIEMLFEVLKSAKHLFDVKYWKTIYRSILLPIFEDLKGENDDEEMGRRRSISPSRRSSTIKLDNTAAWPLALQQMVELFTFIFDTISASQDGLVLIDGVLGLVISMLGKKDEKLATTGQVCLQQFIHRNIGKFISADVKNNGVWEIVTEAIERACWVTSPAELLNCEIETSADTTDTMAPMNNKPATITNAIILLGLNKAINRGAVAAKQALTLGDAMINLQPITDLSDLDFEHTIIKCGTHLELMEAVKNVCLARIGDAEVTSCIINVVPDSYRSRWLQCIYDSYAIARGFNSNYDLRMAIWKKRLVKQLPNLVKQETTSCATFIGLLFVIYRFEGDEGNASVGYAEENSPNSPGKDNLVQVLIFEICDVLERYIEFLSDLQKSSRDIALWSPVVVMIFKELLNMEGWWQHQGRKQQKCQTLKKELPKLFRLAVRCMNSDKGEVRKALQEFIEAVGEEYIK